MRKSPLMKTIEEFAVIVVFVIIVSVLMSIAQMFLPAWAIVVIMITAVVLLFYATYKKNKR